MAKLSPNELQALRIARAYALPRIREVTEDLIREVYGAHSLTDEMQKRKRLRQSRRPEVRAWLEARDRDRDKIITTYRQIKYLINNVLTGANDANKITFLGDKDQVRPVLLDYTALYTTRGYPFSVTQHTAQLPAGGAGVAGGPGPGPG